MPQLPHLSVCVCTFRRSKLLERLLRELQTQQTHAAFTFAVVVVDNDKDRSAHPVVAQFQERSSFALKYCSEPVQNIARARNTAVAHATGDYVAFIDDDEYPSPDWLFELLRTQLANGADGVLGPVKPYYAEQPAAWVIRGGFFERPSHATGYKIGLSDARTGNVLLKRELFAGAESPFAEQFATGGEDVDFFRRAMERGARFVWCNEALVYELVPAERCTRRYLLRRALLRGRNSFKQPANRVASLAKSLIAVPVYAASLTVLWVRGSHVFIKYLIKLCDHGGKLMAAVGLHPVSKRD